MQNIISNLIRYNIEMNKVQIKPTNPVKVERPAKRQKKTVINRLGLLFYIIH